MIRIAVWSGLLVMAMIFCCSCSGSFTTGECSCRKTLRVVVVTGGHDFEREPFLQIFQEAEDILYVEALQKDQSEIFEDISDFPYDVIVLYNMTQDISPRRRANFVKLLNEGVGLVALHHAIGAFKNWQDYREIIGGKYYLEDRVEGGVEHKASSYKHDMEFKVTIADTKHPIGRGLSDFVIEDETYSHCWFAPDNHLLLTTDHPDSDKPVGWVRRFGAARVCYIQLGHGPDAYGNPNYRRLVRQAICWSAGRLGK